MGADMRPSGNGDSWLRQWGAPGVIMALCAGILGMILWYGRIDAHAEDTNLHHTVAQLDECYVQRDTYEDQQAGIDKRLTRIEDKIDRLTERIGAGNR